MPPVPPPSARATAPRDDVFSPAVKRLLAQRVAMRCSICRAATNSPAIRRARPGSAGVAVPICAASPEEPRFDPARAVDDHGSPANAIWLCQMCARWVEEDPDRFSIDELLLLKTRAERVGLDDPALPDGMAERPWFAGAAFLVPDGLEPVSAYRPDPGIVAALAGTSARRAMVIAGPGGAGKTRHAIEIAHDRRAGGAPVLWASASSAATFARSIEAIVDARELDVPIDPAARPETKAHALAAWLGSHSRWLFIIDGADSPEVVREIESLLPALHDGRVIITSRLTAWPSDFDVITLGSWSDDDATAMLAGFEGVDVARIVSELGGLPLAIEQASAYLSSVRCTIPEYLELVAAARRELADLGHPAMADYRASVAAAWRVANARLSPLARDVLELLSQLAPEAIPRALVEALARAPRRRKRKGATDPQSLAVSAAIDELAALGMLVVTRHQVRVHALVQSVVREHPRPLPWHFSLWRRFQRLPEKAVWERARLPVRVAEAMARPGALPWSGAGDARTIEMRSYLPHVEVAAHRIPEDIARSAPTRRQLSRVAAEVPRAAAPPLTAESHRVPLEAARVAAHDGDADRGQRLFAAARERAEREFELAPIDAARVRMAEAFALVRASRDRACALLDEALSLPLDDEDFRRYDVLAAAHLYAMVAATKDDRARALAHIRRVLPRARELMRFDLAIAFAIPYAATRLLAAQSATAALTACDDALRRTRDAGARARVHRARLWEERAALLAAAGRPMPSARAYRQALAIQRRYASPSRFEQARLLRRGGEMCCQAGRSRLAESQLIEAASLLEGGWGDDAEWGENVGGLLGLSLGRVGRLAHAESLLRRALAARGTRVGSFHASLAPLYRLLGVTLQEAGRTAEAEPMFRRALNIVRVADAAPSDDLSRYFDNLAGCLEDLERLDEAVLLRDEARGVRRVVALPTSTPPSTPR